MGLNRRGIAFLVAARQVGVDYDRTLTIGRQSLFANGPAIQSAFAEAGETITSLDARSAVDADGFADRLFEHLGARETCSLDGSDYEGAAIVHDLNEPLPDEHDRFSCVVDSGTLEHVFDFPQALRNCLGLVEVGGHFITITPTNNQMGHGFYQFSPELYHRVLCPENGFRALAVLTRAERRGARWFSAADPARLRGRVILGGAFPSYLYVLGQRVSDRTILDEAPQQADYVRAWGVGEDAALRGHTRRLPDTPVPLTEASEWLKLALRRPTFNGLSPIRLTELPDQCR